MMLQTEKYPYLDWLSRETSIPQASLIKGFDLEKRFHEKILGETDPEVRKVMYADLYRALVPLYESTHNPESGPAGKSAVVDMFQDELAGKSILDAGCGSGNFLMCVCDRLGNRTLCGIDTVLPSKHKLQQERYGHIRFMEADIVDFSLDEKFEVVFSDNVIEHLAPADLSTHLKSIRRALTKDGTLIAILPNRLFGPYDITRIIDNTLTNRLPALGSHLSESTYSEFLPLLRENGFGGFRVPLQLPILHRTLSPLLKHIRISPSIYKWIENRPGLLDVLYKTRRRHSYAFLSAIFIICNKLESGLHNDDARR